MTRALEAMPHFAIYNELAMAHASKRKFTEAMAAAERAGGVSPSWKVPVLTNCGTRTTQERQHTSGTCYTEFVGRVPGLMAH